MSSPTQLLRSRRVTPLPESCSLRKKTQPPLQQKGRMYEPDDTATQYIEYHFQITDNIQCDTGEETGKVIIMIRHAMHSKKKRAGGE